MAVNTTTIATGGYWGGTVGVRTTSLATSGYWGRSYVSPFIHSRISLETTKPYIKLSTTKPHIELETTKPYIRLVTR